MMSTAPRVVIVFLRDLYAGSFLWPGPRDLVLRLLGFTFETEGPATSSTIETSSSSGTANCAPKDIFCSLLLIFLGASSFDVFAFFLPLGETTSSSISTSITASPRDFLLLPLFVGVEAGSASITSSSSSTRMGRAGVTGSKLSASCTSEDLTEVCRRALPVGVPTKSLLGVFLWITPPSGATSRPTGSAPESRLERREGVDGAAEGVKGASEREACRTRLDGVVGAPVSKSRDPDNLRDLLEGVTGKLSSSAAGGFLLFLPGVRSVCIGVFSYLVGVWGSLEGVLLTGDSIPTWESSNLLRRSALLPATERPRALSSSLSSTTVMFPSSFSPSSILTLSLPTFSFSLVVTAPLLARDLREVSRVVAPSEAGLPIFARGE